MSFFSPKIFIFKSRIMKNYKPKFENISSNEERKKNLLKLKSRLNSAKLISKSDLRNNNVNEVINKIKFGKAIERYLLIKKKIYLKELDEQMGKKEFKFEKINFVLDKFARNKRHNKFDIKNGIVSRTSNEHSLKINSTFEKVWNKLSTKSYEKFKEDFNYTQDKTKLILKKIKKHKNKLNSMMDMKIKNIKKIFGNDALNREKKKRVEPLLLLIRNSIKKNYNSTKNINSFKYKRCFSNKSLNRNEENNKKVLLKCYDSFNKNCIKSKGNKEINFNETNEINFSDLTNFSTSEKNQLKKQFRFKSSNQRPSRNIKNSNINLESESQNNNNIMKDFNYFTKKNPQMKQTYLKNNILKLDKMKNSTKKKDKESIKNFLSNNYIMGSAKIKPNKKIDKRRSNFKERLIKSAEIIFNDEEYDY